LEFRPGAAWAILLDVAPHPGKELVGGAMMGSDRATRAADRTEE
jgi:hypothetical protein